MTKITTPRELFVDPEIQAYNIIIELEEDLSRCQKGLQQYRIISTSICDNKRVHQIIKRAYEIAGWKVKISKDHDGGNKVLVILRTK